MSGLQTWKNNGLVHPAETILNEICSSEIQVDGQTLLRSMCSWIKMNKHADKNLGKVVHSFFHVHPCRQRTNTPFSMLVLSTLLYIFEDLPREKKRR